MRVQIIYLLFTTDAKVSFDRDKSPLLGGDLGVGKSVIREILNKISRPDNPPLTPPKRGISCDTLKPA